MPFAGIGDRHRYLWPGRGRREALDLLVVVRGIRNDGDDNLVVIPGGDMCGHSHGGPCGDPDGAGFPFGNRQAGLDRSFIVDFAEAIDVMGMSEQKRRRSMQPSPRGQVAARTTSEDGRPRGLDRYHPDVRAVRFQRPCNAQKGSARADGGHDHIYPPVQRPKDFRSGRLFVCQHSGFVGVLVEPQPAGLAAQTFGFSNAGRPMVRMHATLDDAHLRSARSQPVDLAFQHRRIDQASHTHPDVRHQCRKRQAQISRCRFDNPTPRLDLASSDHVRQQIVCGPGLDAPGGVELLEFKGKLTLRAEIARPVQGGSSDAVVTHVPQASHQSCLCYVSSPLRFYTRLLNNSGRFCAHSLSAWIEAMCLSAFWRMCWLQTWT
ncbi:hypothetical protein EDC29_1241 [Marichromatium gracile]|uniref:Uncharacterized protein n=1 Tax=Marichromatium gracile TaxID=1048 RepID=A0A4R4A4P0_MARGR|nr:hypothetical protein EDC29_1241 [Marichromatium gracile]